MWQDALRLGPGATFSSRDMDSQQCALALHARGGPFEPLPRRAGPSGNQKCGRRRLVGADPPHQGAAARAMVALKPLSPSRARQGARQPVAAQNPAHAARREVAGGMAHKPACNQCGPWAPLARGGRIIGRHERVAVVGAPGAWEGWGQAGNPSGPEGHHMPGRTKKPWPCALASFARAAKALALSLQGGARTRRGARAAATGNCGGGKKQGDAPYVEGRSEAGRRGFPWPAAWAAGEGAQGGGLTPSCEGQHSRSDLSLRALPGRRAGWARR